MAKIVVEREGTDELKTLIKAALDNEQKIINIGIRKTREHLQKLEDKYKMDSDSFYRKYSSGEMGDDMEYIRWAGEVETLTKLQMNLKALRSCRRKYKYSYHYESSDNLLIFRYDMAPHFRSIETFPRHKHERGGVFPPKEPFLQDVLFEIEKLIV